MTDEEFDQLKPCLSCKQKDRKEINIMKEKIIINLRKGLTETTLYNVVCSCGYEGPNCKDRQIAINLWNFVNFK